MSNRDCIDWKNRINKHDMIWEIFPADWTEGPFLGNGCMGVQLFHNMETGVLHMELGRNDVCDTRPSGSTCTDVCFQNPRLPIGFMELAYHGKPQSMKMRLDLYHAKLMGVLETDLGCINFEILVHSEEMLVMAFFKGTKGEKDVHWVFVPQDAVSPRQKFGMERGQSFRIMKDYQYNEPPTIESRDHRGYSRQKLSSGYENIVCWKEVNNKSRCLLVHIVQGKTGILQKAMDYLDCFDAPEELLPVHYNWWETYYQRSSISIPDQRLEAFYWIQIYKLACATRNRKDAVVIDNQGPWLCCSTPWPATWWNLNVQLSYLPCYASNHADLSLSLSNKLKENMQQLIENVPPEFRYDSAGIGSISDLYLRSPVAKAGNEPVQGMRELGNLTWIMHNCWLYYQVTMDEEYLQELVYPLLRRCVNYYLHFLWKDSDGVYHLQPTSSPEYGKDCPDCNYDLALLRFGCKTLLKIIEILAVEDDKAAIWKDVLKNLVPYPAGENGFMIGEGLPYGYSHRHFSHLMMIYPLYDVTLEDKEQIPLLEKSVEYWWSKPEALAGFSCTGASLIWSALGNGDKALYYLEQLWNGMLLPNTLYREDGPVIETPLSGAQSIIEMLMQSHNGVIRYFPAVPAKWKNASFETLLAQGGFEVSGEYKDGRLYALTVKSKAGMPCVLESKDWDIMDLNDARIIRINKERIEVKLKKNEYISIERKRTDENN